MRSRLAELSDQEPPKRYQGKLAKFRPEKGFGFIVSDEVHEEFGKDTFVSDKEIGGLDLKVGDDVSFTIVVNRDNKPQARLVMLLGRTEPITPPPPSVPQCFTSVAAVPPETAPMLQCQPVPPLPIPKQLPRQPPTAPPAPQFVCPPPLKVPRLIPPNPSRSMTPSDGELADRFFRHNRQFFC